MMNRAAALRYARALFEVSQQQGDPERVEREMSGFVDLMREHPPLRSSLVNPSIPPARKRAIVADLVPRLGDVSTVTGRLLMLLADRDRFSMLEELLQVYRDRLTALQGVVRARITTATALSPERVDRIASTLQGATGRQVALETEVDSTLVGGMVAQIGSRVYDGSVASHLDRLRRRFLGDA